MDSPQTEEWKAKPHLYTIVKVARDVDLSQQIGSNIQFDLVDFKRVRTFHVRNEIPFVGFKEIVAKYLDIPAKFHRYWVWRKRKDHTYCPYRYLKQSEEDDLQVGQLRKLVNQNNNAELSLFLEIEHDEVGQLKKLVNQNNDTGLNLFLEIEHDERQFLIAPPDIAIEDTLIFFKFYDRKEMKLRYVGRRFVNSLTEPIMMQGILKEMADLDPNEEIELFEETRKQTCTNLISDMKSVGVPFDIESPFSEQEISNGGIICFQKNSETQQMMEYKYPYVEEFLKYMRDRQIVHFESLKRPEDFFLELSMVDGYEVVVKKMALKLDLEDYLKIRITQHNLYSQQPELHPFGHGEKHFNETC